MYRHLAGTDACVYCTGPEDCSTGNGIGACVAACPPNANYITQDGEITCRCLPPRRRVMRVCTCVCCVRVCLQFVCVLVGVSLSLSRAYVYVCVCV